MDIVIENRWLRGATKTLAGLLLTAAVTVCGWQEWVWLDAHEDIIADGPMWHGFAMVSVLVITLIVACMAALYGWASLSYAVSPTCTWENCTVWRHETRHDRTFVMVGQVPVYNTSTSHVLVTDRGSWACDDDFAGTRVGDRYTIRTRDGIVLDVTPAT